MAETTMERIRREAEEKKAAALRDELNSGANPPLKSVETSSVPHVIQKADGVRGDDSNPKGLDGNFDNPDQRISSGNRLVSSDGVVVPENEFTLELQKLHDEIERLTKEYTDGGLQVSDFPASYAILTNQYRIKAAALNRTVGGVGPEETKVLKEIAEMKTKLDLKLVDARNRDAKNAEDRKTLNQVKSVPTSEEDKRKEDERIAQQNEEMRKGGIL